MPVEIHRLETADIRVEILPEIGARLHRIRVRGVDLLRTPGDPRRHETEPFFWGAYNMAPWCNRIDAGQVRAGNRTLDLAPNFRDGTAIHGQAYARPWQTGEQGSYRFSGGGEGWPWPYEVGMVVTVGESSVRIAQRVTNLAEDEMPAGIGLHPWFVGSPQVAISAERVYSTNTDSPSQPQPVSGDHDLRLIGPMPRGLDATWTELGQPAVSLRWDQHDLAVAMLSDATTLHITAASPTDIDALAIEPQTHAPQGLRRLLRGEPGALKMLVPGATLEQVIEMRFEMYGGIQK